MPARIESSVVLPAPLGPMIATTSPRDARSDTPRSASRSPKRLRRSRASSSAATSAAGAPVTPGNLDGAAGILRRVKLLFIGDVVGAAGRRAVAEVLPCLREREQPDVVVVNGAN